MKLSLVFILIICSYFSFAQKTKILFIGNSHTYVNNLPLVFKDLALEGGDTVIVDSSTPGGHSLMQHSTNSTTISKIYSQDWDYVVLQDQSQIPSRESDRDSLMYPYAIKLDSMIHDNYECTKTIFYMTWAHKPGDLDIIAAGGTDSFEAMQQRVRAGYAEIADSLHAIIAPAGWAWRRVINLDSTIELHSSDLYHPALNGTYLTACVFYATLFRKPSLGINYYSTIDSTTATFLQAVADSVVLDSSWVWGIGNYDLSSHFSWIETVNGVQFTNSSLHADSYYWDFGDGTTSTEENPLHTYSQVGDFIVQLKASNTCEEIFYVDTIQNTIVSLENNFKSKIRIYPNPTHELIVIENIDGSLIYNIQIFNSIGVKLSDHSLPLNENRVIIPIHHLKKGLYYFSLTHVSGIERISFIKD